MGGETGALREALGAITDANLRLRQQLEANERVTREVIARLDAGESVVDALQVTAWRNERDELDGLVRELYARRHEARDAAIASGLEEGKGSSEIAAALDLNSELVADLGAGHGAGLALLPMDGVGSD